MAALLAARRWSLVTLDATHTLLRPNRPIGAIYVRRLSLAV